MNAAPLLVVGAAAAVGYATSGGVVFPRAVAVAVSSVKSAITGEPAWVHPMPAIRVEGRVYRPTESSGWGSPRVGGAPGDSHRGTDQMYKRRTVTSYRRADGKTIITGGDLHSRYPVYKDGHAGWFFCPRGVWCGAVADGAVWSAKLTATGWSVVLSHGAPWATYYTHLTRLHPSIVETTRGGSGQRVRAGDLLGEVGVSPYNPGGIRHLHFAGWLGGTESSAVDMWPRMRTWPVTREQVL